MSLGILENVDSPQIDPPHLCLWLRQSLPLADSHLTLCSGVLEHQVPICRIRMELDDDLLVFMGKMAFSLARC